MKYLFICLLLTNIVLAQEKNEEKKDKKIVAEHSDTILVTATRIDKKLSETSLSIGQVGDEEIKSIRPSHPSEVTNRISGVFINNLGGESHFTAIRNNLSTGADYLFLENGVPTRSTGFFNHNALYEINVPQSSGIEVLKGPGTALYGSDALHGVINVLTGKVPDKQLLKLGVEYGSTTNWYRHLITYGDRINEERAFRLDFNQTLSGGYRDYTDYSRHSATAQWLWTPSTDFSMKTVLSYNYVDQSTVSGLSRYDWKHNPQENLFQVPGRDIESLRFSSKLTKIIDERSEISFTPYFRQSETNGLIPSFRFSSRPASNFNNTDLSEIWDTGFQSYGALSSYTRYFDKWDSLLVFGLDFDYTSGDDKVEEILLSRDFRPDGRVFFLDYGRTGNVLFDYDANYFSYSPYLYFEVSPLDFLHLDFGLRYDYTRVELDQQNNIAGAIENTSTSFQQLSPKFGFIVDYITDHQLYGSYRRGFRAPSVSNLFRAPVSENSTDLEPTIIDSFELGFRGQAMSNLFYDVTVYYSDKKNDIIRFRDPSNANLRTANNNGETSHRGVELTLKWNISDELDFKFTGTHSLHKYEKSDLGTAAFPGAASGSELEGNELERAPKYFQSYIFDYHPSWLKGGNIELEVTNLGSYYTDSRNTDKYGGHELFNIRFQYPLTEKLTVYGRLINILDRDNTSSTSSDAATGFQPGEPRSFFFGLEYEL